MNSIKLKEKLISLEGTIEEYEGFIAKNETTLHQNHYHFLTAKHTLLQMLGRSEGCLIQDMPMEKVNSQNNFVLLIIIYFIFNCFTAETKRTFVSRSSSTVPKIGSSHGSFANLYRLAFGYIFV